MVEDIKKPRILLPVRVTDDGDMFLQETGQKVFGRPVGEPRILVLLDYVRNPSNEDLVTGHARKLSTAAPIAANAYSLGKDRRAGLLGGKSLDCEVDGECAVFRQTVQYLILDEPSLDLARQSIY